MYYVSCYVSFLVSKSLLKSIRITLVYLTHVVPARASQFHVYVISRDGTQE